MGHNLVNKFMQYVGGFGEGIPPIEFNTTAELLSLPAIKEFSARPGFQYIAISSDCIYYVGDGGFDRELIGSIKHMGGIDLLPLQPWKFRAILPDGTKTILTSEVKSMVGEVLTLHDGTTATNIDFK